jgi:hypothetical protein
MLRDPVGRYKMGRGTFREGLIYKLKRFRQIDTILFSFTLLEIIMTCIETKFIFQFEG